MPNKRPRPNGYQEEEDKRRLIEVLKRLENDLREERRIKNHNKTLAQEIDVLQAYFNKFR